MSSTLDNQSQDLQQIDPAVVVQQVTVNQVVVQQGAPNQVEMPNIVDGMDVQMSQLPMMDPMNNFRRSGM